jgi:serine/threonine protein kinase
MIIPKYKTIQELSGNDWYALHRGQRVEDQTPVLLKTTRRITQDTADVELLQREFETLRQLSIAGVTGVYEFLRHSAPCCLVMEDRGGKQLEALPTSHGGDLDFFFKVAIQLSAILSELHRRKLVHHNVNPSSVLVNPMTGEVQLIDFSFASGTASESHWPLPQQLSRVARGAQVHLTRADRPDESDH